MYKELQSKVIGRFGQVVSMLCYLYGLKIQRVHHDIAVGGGYRRVEWITPELIIALEWYPDATTAYAAPWVSFRHPGIPWASMDVDTGYKHYPVSSSYPLEDDLDLERLLDNWNPDEVWDRYIWESIEPMEFADGDYGKLHLPAGRKRQIKIHLISEDTYDYDGRRYTIDNETGIITSREIESEFDLEP